MHGGRCCKPSILPNSQLRPLSAFSVPAAARHYPIQSSVDGCRVWASRGQGGLRWMIRQKLPLRSSSQVVLPYDDAGIMEGERDTGSGIQQRDVSVREGEGRKRRGLPIGEFVVRCCKRGLLARGQTVRRSRGVARVGRAPFQLQVRDPLRCEAFIRVCIKPIAAEILASQ